MNPQKVQRDRLNKLEDLPNIGKEMATDLRIIGIRTPEQLVGKDPFKLYEALCENTGMRHDPCVIDVFISIVRFMDGGEALPWWSFTAERKRTYRKNDYLKAVALPLNCRRYCAGESPVARLNSLLKEETSS